MISLWSILGDSWSILGNLCKKTSFRIISFSFQLCNYSCLWFSFVVNDSCKGTDNFCSFLKKAKKLLHFNIRLHGILTFLRASMRHIVMVGQYAPKSI
jgi:hypothetical protein